MPFGTLTICDFSIKILRRTSQGKPSGGGLNQKGVAKYSDFGPFQGYISEMVQYRSEVSINR